MQVSDFSQEQLVLDLFRKEERQKGRQLLIGYISDAAKQRKFKEADRLRGLLIEIEPTALFDIIRTGEIIENEKTAAVDKNILAVWSALIKIIELKEFLAIYYSMEQRRFAHKEMVITQGKQNSTLFFINSGRVEIFFQEGGKKVPIKSMGAGEVLGAGTFFEASVSTINARSLGVETSVLKLDTMQEWQKDYPGLEAKLIDFCSRFKITADSFVTTGQDRRTYKRERISGTVKMILFDKEGNDSGIVAKGELFDISAGGASFFLRMSRKSNARMLLGRTVGLTLSLSANVMFNITGVVRAVRSQPIVGNEYAVSVQFSRLLVHKELKDLVASTQ